MYDKTPLLRVVGEGFEEGVLETNKNIFGWNEKETKLNLFRLFSVCFTKQFFWFVSICFGVSNMYRNNRN
jgi:hypothetical protein